MNQGTMPHETLGPPAPTRRADTGLSVLAALTSFGAVLAAASCCVLPLALAAMGVGAGVSSTFAALMPLRWPLTVKRGIDRAAVSAPKKPEEEGQETAGSRQVEECPPELGARGVPIESGVPPVEAAMALGRLIW